MATEKVSLNTSSHIGNTTKMFTLQTYLKKRLLMFKWKIWNRYLQAKQFAEQEDGTDIKMHQNKYTLSKYDTNDKRHLYCKKPLYYIFLFVSGFCLLFRNTYLKCHFWMASKHHVTLITLGNSLSVLQQEEDIYLADVHIREGMRPHNIHSVLPNAFA